MKYTGMHIDGVPVYSDPEAPKDTLFMMNSEFIKKQPRRNGKLTAVEKPEGLQGIIEDDSFSQITYRGKPFLPDKSTKSQTWTVFDPTLPIVTSVKVNDKEVPFRINKNGTISICMTK